MPTEERKLHKDTRTTHSYTPSQAKGLSECGHWVRAKHLRHSWDYVTCEKCLRKRPK